MEGIEQWKTEAQQWLRQGIEYAHQIPPTQLYAAVAVLLFTTLLLLIIRLLKRTKSNTIVLSGLSGSGKTVLFYQLRDGSSHQGTVTSMEPNEGTFLLHSESAKKGKIKPVHVVDVPGHSRLRPKLDEFLPQAAGIVFVVDALEFLPNLSAVTEYLYDILTKASVVKRKLPVLICCNKTDKVTAHTKEFIRKQLEKEIEKLRVSRSGVSDADIANDYALGIPGEVFSFSQCINKVTVGEASGLTGDISQPTDCLKNSRKMQGTTCTLLEQSGGEEDKNENEIQVEISHLKLCKELKCSRPTMRLAQSKSFISELPSQQIPGLCHRSAEVNFEGRPRSQRANQKRENVEMSPLSLILLYLPSLAVLVDGKSPSYDWTVSFSHLAPLALPKQVIVINDQFPGPLLNATTNDVLNINERAANEKEFVARWSAGDELSDTTWPKLDIQFSTAGGYGPIRVNNREVIPLPFPQPHGDIDVLIGDWYSADHRNPIGILINGRGPNETVFKFKPGATYRLRISNVGLKTSFNFRIQDHLMLLVETEGSYTAQQTYRSLDIHVGQSYSVLVTAKNQTCGKSYYMVASSRLTDAELLGVGVIRYPNSDDFPSGPLPSGPQLHDYFYSIEQARSIRWNLSAGAARPNPQGSYHYGRINVSRTIVLRNGEMADYFELESSRTGNFPDTPTDNGISTLGASVINANYREFYHLVFENPTPYLQTWHLDGYNFFVVGMESGTSSWEEDMKATYNLNDAVFRSTVQVYPSGWTAVMVMLDNQGLWNLRSQDAERWYLGQELYVRVRGIGEEDPSTIPVRDEVPIPENAILCGGISGL
ncbi:MULTI-COPPER OXIDASE [Salix purpurea]|uniref:Signal recognition particle receptor subunit beta n=1 Tax=Salix purpurea TaxID=77065 RepID=A0A9Q0PAN0_SALPP|nr:MULTI-COPPER OXIDASE [Salix purpurea]